MWNDLDPSSSFIFITSEDYAYKKLTQDGRIVQSKLLEKYRHFYTLLTVLLKNQSKDTLKELSQANEEILKTIEQEHTWCKNTEEALDNVVRLLQKQVGLLEQVYEFSNETVYIPDTNALICNPDLESWKFPETLRFTIALLPTVLSELDSLKVNYRNEGVRKKAGKLIRQIKEYRRRGKLSTGVPLIKNKTTIQAFAIEPDMENSLSWLDKNNNDDRILANVIEVMRIQPHSPVIIVSRDINLQNKAELANIPFTEPPEPTA